MALPPHLVGLRRKGKDIPRLPLSAFSPPATGTSDTFPLPPTPSFISPSGIADAHLHVSADASGAYTADIAHLKRAHTRAVVLSPSGRPAVQIINALQSLHSIPLDARVLAVLVPFALEGSQVPEYPSDPAVRPLALTTVYDGVIPIAPDAEEENKEYAQVETPARNLTWALQHGRVVDLDIKGGVLATDTSFYDSLVNLLTKAIKSQSTIKHTPIVLTSLLPPPLGSVTPIVGLMNHPTYTAYRQRVSSLSLFENVYVKLHSPAWVSIGSDARLDPKREKEFRDILKLFFVPVLEAFGFERIIFGSSPASAGGSPALAELWYKIVLESCRELAVSQDEMDKIFIDNAERIYGST